MLCGYLHDLNFHSWNIEQISIFRRTQNHLLNIFIFTNCRRHEIPKNNVNETNKKTEVYWHRSILHFSQQEFFHLLCSEEAIKRKNNRVALWVKLRPCKIAKGRRESAVEGRRARERRIKVDRLSVWRRLRKTNQRVRGLRGMSPPTFSIFSPIFRGAERDFMAGAAAKRVCSHAGGVKVANFTLVKLEED